MGFRQTSWFRYRVVIYGVVAVAIFVYRNHIDWSRLTAGLQQPDPAAGTLLITGGAVAPDLVEILVGRYGGDYPALDIQTLGGGTNQALEDLLNLRADVALLTRPPTAAEQGLFRQVDGDTAVVAPIGIGGLLILAGTETLGGEPSLTMAQLGGLLRGETRDICDRLYAADPNLGHWAAAARLLEQSPEPVDRETVIYLADDRGVAQAVANDPRALGLIVSFDLPTAPEPTHVPVREEAGGVAVEPTYESTAGGDYPLYVTLYVACRTNGGIEGAKFVTHLTSGRGQRQIERAGCIPARQVLREIILTNGAPGE
jgi:ABC-type phosphate transport system substrate-binding protein